MSLDEMLSSYEASRQQKLEQKRQEREAVKAYEVKRKQNTDDFNRNNLVVVDFRTGELISQ